MLIAWITEQLAANGLHCFITRSCAVAARKWHDSFDINKRTAAILVKIMSIFLGDPHPRKIFFVFFSRPVTRSRFAPVDAQIIGANKS